jgi:hypothetical protein
MSGKKTAKSVSAILDGYSPSNKLNVNNPPLSGSAVPLLTVPNVDRKFSQQTSPVNQLVKSAKR